MTVRRVALVGVALVFCIATGPEARPATSAWGCSFSSAPVVPTGRMLALPTAGCDVTDRLHAFSKVRLRVGDVVTLRVIAGGSFVRLGFYRPGALEEDSINRTGDSDCFVAPDAHEAAQARCTIARTGTYIFYATVPGSGPAGQAGVFVKHSPSRRLVQGRCGGRTRVPLFAAGTTQYTDYAQACGLKDLSRTPPIDLDQRWRVRLRAGQHRLTARRATPVRLDKGDTWVQHITLVKPNTDPADVDNPGRQVCLLEIDDQEAGGSVSCPVGRTGVYTVLAGGGGDVIAFTVR